MKFINRFFTGNPSHNNFILFGKVHLILLFIAVLGSAYILIKKNENRKTELIIGSVLILQQISLYSWYFSANYNPIQEGLPLYHCRIAILLIGFGMLFNKNIFMKIGSYWGIFGSISALLFPGIDPFTFPHITQFSYFIGHLFLLWGSVYLLFVKKIGMIEVDFKTTFIFTNIYHLLMFILNDRIGSNYAYMSSPPISILNCWNPYIYGFEVIMTFNIILSIEYILINKNMFIDKISKNIVKDEPECSIEKYSL